MRIIMTAGLAALLWFSATPGAVARDHGGVNWSVNVGVPGPVYGPPAYYQPQPVYVQPRPVYVQPRPVYVPPPVYYSGYESPYYRHPGYRHHHRRHHHGHR